MRYKNVAGRFFALVTKLTHVTERQTDRRTDRQNYDCQDRANIAASRGKKIVIFDQYLADSLYLRNNARHGHNYIIAMDG